MSPADLVAARQLESALYRYRVTVESNGSTVAPELRFLERLSAFCVTQGQAGSRFGESVELVDVVAVTPRLLTYKQTAEALSCSESTVKRLVADGTLPVVHVGHAARVRVSDLDDYVSALGKGTAA